MEAAGAEVGGGAELGAEAEEGATVGGGGRAGGSFLRGGRVGSWWAGAAGGGSRDIEDRLEERSFNSSSFSVFRAKQKSDTLFWKVTRS